MWYLHIYSCDASEKISQLTDAVYCSPVGHIVAQHDMLYTDDTQLHLATHASRTLTSDITLSYTQNDLQFDSDKLETPTGLRVKDRRVGRKREGAGGKE